MITVKDAIKRLSFTISKQNKPNSNDADALNSIIEFVNNSNKQVVKENELTAKLFCFILKEFAFHYKDVNIASKQINKDILSKPLLYHIEFLKNQLKTIELDLFFKSLNLNPTWENGQNLDEIRKNVLLNKDIYKNVNIDELAEVYETWDNDNTIANFEMNFNLILNTYKNV